MKLQEVALHVCIGLCIDGKDRMTWERKGFPEVYLYTENHPMAIPETHKIQ